MFYIILLLFFDDFIFKVFRVPKFKLLGAFFEKSKTENQMQITVFQRKEISENESLVANPKNSYDTIFPESLSGQVFNILQNGYRITDFLFLGDTRNSLRNIRLNLQSLNINNSQLHIFSFYQLAAHIFRNYDFLVNKKNYREITRSEQLDIIQKICLTEDQYQYTKNISLYIINCKKNRVRDFQKFNFVSFLKNKGIFESFDSDSIETHESNFIIDENSLNEFANYVYTKYQAILLKGHLIDYEDLIYHSTQILIHNPSIVSFYRKKYKSIVINCKQTFAINKPHIRNFIQTLFFPEDSRMAESDHCHVSYFNEPFPFSSTSTTHSCNKEIMNTSAEVSDFDSEYENRSFSPLIFLNSKHKRGFCYHELFSDEIVDYFSDYDISENDIERSESFSNDEESGILEEQKIDYLSELISKKKRLANHCYSYEENGVTSKQRRFSYYGQNSVHFFDEMRSNFIRIANSHQFFSDDSLNF